MVVELVSAPQGLEVNLGRVVVHDPLEHGEMGAGDVVLGVGIGTAHETAALLKMMAAQGAAVLVLRGGANALPVAASDDVAILAVPAGTPWAQVVVLVSSVLASDRFRTGDERLDDSSPRDLFAVANAIADTIGAPVTIEDAQSTVLAFSGRQDEADAARVETVLGRRVPDRIRRILNEKGIFRRLYSEPGPVYCESLGPDVLPRAAVAVRAGDEVLGSIWAAVQGPLSTDQEKGLADAAHFVALHLLRHQLAADAQRGLEADLVAAILTGGSLANEASRRLNISGTAFRVVAVGLGDNDRADRDLQLARCRNLLALQLSAIHRGAPTAQLGGVVYGIVPSAAAGASAVSLRQLLEKYVTRASTVVRARILVAIGNQVADIGAIPLSRQTADTILRVLTAEPGTGIAEMDDVRATALLMDFAEAYADDPALTGGPVGTLMAHDAAHRTNYTETLEAYLDAFRDMDEAARVLNVHTNTVRYRMRQLNRMVDLRLDDPSQRLGLMLQLRLRRIARS